MSIESSFYAGGGWIQNLPIADRMYRGGGGKILNWGYYIFIYFSYYLYKKKYKTNANAKINKNKNKNLELVSNAIINYPAADKHPPPQKKKGMQHRKSPQIRLDHLREPKIQLQRSR